MGILDLSGKNALVTGVSDDDGFGWSIAKSLQAAGARVFLATHPRTAGIVRRLLDRAQSAEDRRLPYGVAGELAPVALFPCDVAYDSAAEMPTELREQKGYAGVDASIAGAAAAYRAAAAGPLDILIHSVAFSPEIAHDVLSTSRTAYLVAQSVSAYSLAALARAFLPDMEGRGASLVGLSYIAGERVVAGYGGGMAAAKAALECEARSLAGALGPKGHRVNIVSAGPYPSRAARAIGNVEVMVEHAAQKSPLARPITREEVADAVLFLCSPLSRGITGELLHVDAGYHVMAP